MDVAESNTLAILSPVQWKIVANTVRDLASISPGEHFYSLVWMTFRLTEPLRRLVPTPSAT